MSLMHLSQPSCCLIYRERMLLNVINVLIEWMSGTVPQSENKDAAYPFLALLGRFSLFVSCLSCVGPQGNTLHLRYHLDLIHFVRCKSVGEFIGGIKPALTALRSHSHCTIGRKCQDKPVKSQGTHVHTPCSRGQAKVFIVSVSQFQRCCSILPLSAQNMFQDP